MNLESLFESINAGYSSRKTAAQIIAADPVLLRIFIVIITENRKDYSLKALLILEMLGRYHFKKLSPSLSEVIDSGKLYTDSSSRRCLSKIFSYAIREASTKSDFSLTDKSKKKIIDLSFQWLLPGEKTAVQVFSMQNLFALRHQEKWIAPELYGILDKETAGASAGYKSRAVKILRKLKQEFSSKI